MLYVLRALAALWRQNLHRTKLVLCWGRVQLDGVCGARPKQLAKPANIIWPYGDIVKRHALCIPVKLHKYHQRGVLNTATLGWTEHSKTINICQLTKPPGHLVIWHSVLCIQQSKEQQQARRVAAPNKKGKPWPCMSNRACPTFLGRVMQR